MGDTNTTSLSQRTDRRSSRSGSSSSDRRDRRLDVSGANGQGCACPPGRDDKYQDYNSRGYPIGRSAIAGGASPLTRREAQTFVQASGSIALQIETYVLKTDLFEFLHHDVARGLFEPAGEFVLRDFDPGQISVIADTKLPKAKFLHELLARSDLL